MDLGHFPEFAGGPVFHLMSKRAIWSSERCRKSAPASLAPNVDQNFFRPPSPVWSPPKDTAGGGVGAAWPGPSADAVGGAGEERAPALACVPLGEAKGEGVHVLEEECVRLARVVHLVRERTREERRQTGRLDDEALRAGGAALLVGLTEAKARREAEAQRVAAERADGPDRQVDGGDDGDGPRALGRRFQRPDPSLGAAGDDNPLGYVECHPVGVAGARVHAPCGPRVW